MVIIRCYIQIFISAGPGSAAVPSPPGKAGRLRKQAKHWARTRVDDACLVSFPIIFILFNVIYWSVCLSSAPSREKVLGIPEIEMNTGL